MNVLNATASRGTALRICCKKKGFVDHALLIMDYTLGETAL